MSLTLQVNNENYDNFTSATVEYSMINLCRAFTFTAIAQNGLSLPFSGGESCQVLIDDEIILDGFIESIEVSYSATDHTITVAGRDKGADIVDSTLEKLELQGEQTLEQVILTTLKQINITDISVINNVSDLKPFNAEEDKLSPNTGESAWEFLESLARKKNVLLRMNNEANILIDRVSSEITSTNDTFLLNELGSNQNNILSASKSIDLTETFNKYIVRSQANVSTFSFSSGKQTADELTNKQGQSINTNIRESRVLVLQSELITANDGSTTRADWENNYRNSKQLSYTAVVDGFRDVNGQLWDVNQIVNIRDDFSAINENLLLNAVTFNFDLGDGEQTELSFVNRDSYSLAIQSEQFEKKDTNVGSPF